MAIRTNNTRATDHFERLNYHYGQIMTERDFRDQQLYYNEKRWMMNRFGFGWGVMHGLMVHLKAGDNVASRTLPVIEIDPGFALDLYGNEIQTLSVREYNLDYLLNSWNNKYAGENNSNITFDIGKVTKLYIAVMYHECGTEPFHLPDMHCCDPEQECAFSRTRESFEFVASTSNWSGENREPVFDEYGCFIDCFHDLRNPQTRIIKDHPQRKKLKPVPLSIVSYENGQWVVDNYSNRQVAYSTYRLSELVNCMTKELWKVNSAGYDRRSFVPLLAQTIPGCNYRNGHSLLIENIGKRPFRITTDGTKVWCTDKELPVVHCISTQPTANDPVNPDIALKSGVPAWGVAYDGHYMWVTIPEKDALEKINVCTLKSSVITDKRFANPREIVFDGKYLWISHGPGNFNHHQHDHNHHHTSDIPSWESEGKHHSQHHDPHGNHNHNQYVNSDIPSWESDASHSSQHHDSHGNHNHNQHVNSEIPSWESEGKHSNNHTEEQDRHNHDHHDHIDASGTPHWDSDEKPLHDKEMVEDIIISRYDPETGELQTFTLCSKGKYSPVNGIIYDGQAIWVLYNDIHCNAVVQKIDTCQMIAGKETGDGRNRHISHRESGRENEYEARSVYRPINLRKRFGRDITFDGNAVWVVHSDGLSKIDTTRYEETGNSTDRGHLSAMAFDGNVMWAVQNRGDEADLRRYDLYTLDYRGGNELRGKHGDLHLGRICFDGSYLWIIGQKIYKTNDEHINNNKPEDVEKPIRKGIIYRVLP